MRGRGQARCVACPGTRFSAEARASAGVVDVSTPIAVGQWIADVSLVACHIAIRLRGVPTSLTPQPGWSGGGLDRGAALELDHLAAGFGA